LFYPQPHGCELSGGGGEIGVRACGVNRVAALRPRRRKENEMLSCRAMPIFLSVLVLLPGCAPMSLQPGDRAQVCRIEVDARLPQPVFVANPASSESGMLVGAGAGALQGLLTGPAAIVAVPILGIVGAAVGAACADSASRHPSANADFEKILAAADIDLLRQALEVELNAPRAECPKAMADAPPVTGPDAIVEIEKAEATMGCLFGKQAYSIAVQWRIVGVRGGRVLAASTTSCSVSSFRSVDDWFADPGYAQAEIERLLEKAGRHVAVSLLGAVAPGRCVYRSREDGKLE
jgi:hypothetical protein